MQVSNSTGQNTDYRVGATGRGVDGSAYFSAETVIATMLKHEDMKSSAGAWLCTVDYFFDGNLMASQSFSEDLGLVALGETDRHCIIESPPDTADDVSVAS